MSAVLDIESQDGKLDAPHHEFFGHPETLRRLPPQTLHPSSQLSFLCEIYERLKIFCPTTLVVPLRLCNCPANTEDVQATQCECEEAAATCRKNNHMAYHFGVCRANMIGRLLQPRRNAA
jgi:hypothetical protein